MFLDASFRAASPKLTCSPILRSQAPFSYMLSLIFSTMEPMDSDRVETSSDSERRWGSIM